MKLHLNKEAIAMNDKNMSSQVRVFTVQIDGRINLTSEQVQSINLAIQGRIAELIGSLKIAAQVQPLPKLEGVPEPEDYRRRTTGMMASPLE